MRTVEELSDRLAEERIWRVKEITTVSNLASRAGLPSVEAEFYCRAGSALFYAHWEGYIKRAATYYLKYVAFQRISLADMSDFVMCLYLRQNLADETSTSSQRLLQISQQLRQADDFRPKLQWKNVVDTGSNLSSVVFRKILVQLGFDHSLFDMKSVLIDSKIVKYRNAIAHGEKGEVDLETLTELGREVTGLITQFRDVIENAAATKQHRK